MKTWNKPSMVEVDINETAHGNGVCNIPGHGYDNGPGMGPGNGNGYGHNKKPGCVGGPSDPTDWES